MVVQVSPKVLRSMATFLTSAAYVVVLASLDMFVTATATFLTIAVNAAATGSCAQPNVTFQVDMNLYGDLGESTVFEWQLQ